MGGRTEGNGLGVPGNGRTPKEWLEDPDRTVGAVCGLGLLGWVPAPPRIGFRDRGSTGEVRRVRERQARGRGPRLRSRQAAEGRRRSAAHEEARCAGRYRRPAVLDGGGACLRLPRIGVVPRRRRRDPGGGRRRPGPRRRRGRPARVHARSRPGPEARGDRGRDLQLHTAAERRVGAARRGATAGGRPRHRVPDRRAVADAASDEGCGFDREAGCEGRSEGCREGRAAGAEQAPCDRVRPDPRDGCDGRGTRRGRGPMSAPERYPRRP